jgi:chemotaxis protein methyltransferase CheR
LTVAATDLRLLSRAAGLDLGSYREEHVVERLRRAVARERVADMAALEALLRRDEAARTRFRRSVAVSVSGLFRDRAQFEMLEAEILPALVKSGNRISVWSAGCADGSELYSVALLLDGMEALPRALLLGSDVLEENLVLARAGHYGSERMPPHVRARARWEQRDLAHAEPPPGRWQVVLCRNMAIYFSPAAQDALHAMLASALAHRGTLVLGRSERLRDPAALGLERIAPHTYRRTA